VTNGTLPVSLEWEYERLGQGRCYMGRALSFFEVIRAKVFWLCSELQTDDFSVL
jgi:hypothetical protein